MTGAALDVAAGAGDALVVLADELPPELEPPQAASTSALITARVARPKRRVMKAPWCRGSVPITEDDAGLRRSFRALCAA
jgi:hypothetical protein